MGISERITELKTTMDELDALYVKRDELLRTMNDMMIRENQLQAQIKRINIEIVREG